MCVCVCARVCVRVCVCMRMCVRASMNLIRFFPFRLSSKVVLTLVKRPETVIIVEPVDHTLLGGDGDLIAMDTNDLSGFQRDFPAGK